MDYAGCDTVKASKGGVSSKSSRPVSFVSSSTFLSVDQDLWRTCQVVVFILRYWEDSRPEEKRNEPFVPTGKDKMAMLTHVAPLQKVYLSKSGPELFDVCDNLLARLCISWDSVLAILGE